MSKTLKAFLSVLFFIALSGSIFLLSAGYYVSPDGDDGNTGTEDSPFKTPARARDEVRKVNTNMGGDIVVFFREGIYYLDETFHLDERDGGTNGHNVVYRSYPGENARISGGKVITGWTMSGSVATASTGGLMFRQLFVNDKSAVKARSGGMGSGSAVEQIIFSAGLWGEAYLPLNPDGSVVKTAARRYDSLIRYDGALGGSPSGYRNSPDFIAAPGDWAIDPANEKVYYMPRSGEDMSSAVAVAPVCDPAVLVKGSSVDKFAGNIIFQELTFSHGYWSGFDTLGLTSVFAGVAVVLDSNEEITLGQVGPGVKAEYCHDIRFEKCDFTCMGASGIGMPIACKDNAIIGCTFGEIAGIGISVSPLISTWTGNDTTHLFNPDDHRLYVENVLISNNLVTRCACDYNGSVGILAPFPTAVKIVHNEVRDLPYSGIICGWGARGWKSAMRDNLIRGNLVQDCMNRFNDGGLVYTQSYQPNTIIDSNVLFYSGASQAGGNFFYLDVGSSGLTVKHNCTKGCSYTFGIGFGCFDMVMDSNWVEWGNHTSNNGTPLNEETCKVYQTNVFQGEVNQAIVANVGIHKEDIKLTEVSVKGGMPGSALLIAKNASQAYQVYNLRGQKIIDVKGNLKSFEKNYSKKLSGGTYVVKDVSTRKSFVKTFVKN